MTTILFPRLRAHARGDEGATLVEFALVAIVFFTIVFGIMEFGRMIFDYNIVAQASREGARYASVRGATSGHAATADAVKTYVVNKSVGLLTTSNVTVTWPDGGATPNASGKNVQVTTTYNFNPIVTLVPSATWPLSSTTKMVIVR